MARRRVIALVEDTEIGYDDVGSGLPVVFLHAFPLDRTMWEPQIGALVAECRCIAIDLRGFGESGTAGPYSMARFADDAVGVLDALQIERAVFCGLSMGGYVSFELWRRHRDRVRALVLADTRPTADSDETLARRQELIRAANAGGSGAVANMQIAGMMGRTTRDKRPDVYDATHRLMSQQPVDGVVGALEAMMARPDSTGTLATIDVPVLVVVGDEDVLTPAKDARTMHDGIPGSRLEVLRGAGHLSNVERPAAFNTVMSEFLGGLLYS